MHASPQADGCTPRPPLSPPRRLAARQGVAGRSVAARWSAAMSGMGHLTAVAALVALAAAGAPQLAAGAAIFRPTALFGDHMVLQATDPTDVSSAAQLVGEAASGETVTLEVAFGGTMERTYRTAADASGQWSIGGLKGTQNQGPFVLTLKSAGQTVTANDVWFGIVLMCTGQSNMVWPDASFRAPAAAGSSPTTAALILWSACLPCLSVHVCLPPGGFSPAMRAAAYMRARSQLSPATQELNFHPIYDNKSLIDGWQTHDLPTRPTSPVILHFWATHRSVRAFSGRTPPRSDFSKSRSTPRPPRWRSGPRSVQPLPLPLLPARRLCLFGSAAIPLYPPATQ